MNTKAAPGPYQIQQLETAHNGYPDWPVYAIRSAQNVCLAEVGRVDHFESERIEATAKLLAASWSLLRDLSDFVPLGTMIAARLDILARETPPDANGAKIYPCAALLHDLKELLEKARAAIAKATQVQP